MPLRAKTVLQAAAINKDKLMSMQFLRPVRIIHINEDFKLTNANK